MPLLVYLGQLPAAPTGMPLFASGEQREVTAGEADLLLRNSSFRLVEPAAAEPDQAPAAEPAANGSFVTAL